MPTLGYLIMFVLVIAVVVIMVINNPFAKKEKYVDLDKPGLRTELQQLFRDTYFHEYKNVNFDALYDKDGYPKNDRFTASIRSTQPYQYRQNETFKGNQLFESTAVEKINKANRRSICQPQFINENKEFEKQIPGVELDPAYQTDTDFGILPKKQLYSDYETKYHELDMNGAYLYQTNKILPIAISPFLLNG